MKIYGLLVLVLSALLGYAMASAIGSPAVEVLEAQESGYGHGGHHGGGHHGGGYHHGGGGHHGGGHHGGGGYHNHGGYRG